MTILISNYRIIAVHTGYCIFLGGILLFFIMDFRSTRMLNRMDFDELCAEEDMDRANKPVTKPPIYMRKLLLAIAFIFSLGAVACNNDCDGCEDDDVDSSAEHDRAAPVDSLTKPRLDSLLVPDSLKTAQ